MKNYKIQGGHKLSGSVRIGGSKNATLPIMCAALLSEEKTVLHNVPDIEDVKKMREIFEGIGVKTTFEDGTLEIDPSGISNAPIANELVCNMRASLLLAGPLLGRFGEIDMGYPGGCVLGKRPLDTHILGFEKLGAKALETETKVHLKADKLVGNLIILSEFSVTGTENIIIAAAVAEGNSEIRIAACEPHVEDLCKFLNSMGAKITGLGTHTLSIEGVSSLSGTEHTVVSDYLEAGTFILAGAVTNSTLEVTNFNTHDLDIFFEKLEEAGVNIEMTENGCIVHENGPYKAIPHIKTAVHPGFPTDLLAPFTILLTQCEGVSKIFETLFEGRFSFLFEIEKMGAKIELLNPHQALIIGKSNLQGVPVASCDIRAGAAVVLAALAAEGETLVTNIKYIDRGYEKFEDKLRSLGADIERVE